MIATVECLRGGGAGRVAIRWTLLRVAGFAASAIITLCFGGRLEANEIVVRNLAGELAIDAVIDIGVATADERDGRCRLG